ncbi:MAG TPA: ABC transporter substrate-binding protein [Chloroflexota bacterium]|nr:ABC transporter substrate-binding protein [Chloroflexota bacterium]
MVSAGTTGAVLLAACGGSSSSTKTATTASTATAASATTAASPQASTGQGSAATPAASAAATTAATSATTAVAGKPGGKKTYRVGTPSPITELNPMTTTTEVNNAPQEALFDYVARYTYEPPLGPTILPALAKSWEIQNDAKTYVFHLQTGVKFHNGDDLTADDIKWNWDHVKDPATGSSAGADWKGSTVTVIDPATIKVDFENANTSFIPATIAYTSGKIISPKVYQALGDKWITGPVGSGPFVWGNYLAGTSLTLTKNANYWGTKPKIDEIEFHMAVDDRTASLAISKGEIDAFYIADPNIAITASKANDPKVKFMKAQFGISPFNTWFNLKRPPLDDIRVRQALRYAIDSESIAKDLFGGLAQVINSYLPPFMFGYSDEVTKYAYDPEKAKSLLKAANVSSSWAPEMISQSILVISKQITEAIASYWSDIGIKIKNSSLEQGIITKRSAARDYDMYATYVTRIAPSQMTARFWRSNGASNLSNYTGADALIDQIAAEPDPTKQAALYKQLQQKLSDDSPASWTVAVSEHLLLNERVTGEQGAGWLERFNWFDVDVPAE